MSPSISTSGVPLTVSIKTTRTSGIGVPPAIRKSVCNTDLLLSVKTSSNTLGDRGPELTVTVTLVNESRIDWGTGTAITGPIITVRWIPLSIGRTRNSCWESDQELSADRLQIIRAHRAVGVAQSPK